MTVDRAIQVIQKVIGNTIEEYDQSPQSKTKDDQGNEIRIPHPLDIVDQDDILFALDMAIKETALKASPVSLIETSGSTASELRRLSADFYIRVPAEPTAGDNLDIDDGLAYAVTFKALGQLWTQYSEYEQNGDMIIGTYITAYRKYMEELLSGATPTGNEAYIRFSADGTDWHDSYQSGDIYISFKRIETDAWTPAIKFVGEDGQDGQDAASANFTDLQDTPVDYTGAGGKIAAVKADESGIEFVDAPSGGGGASTFTDLTDTPASLVADKWLKVNAAGDAIELVDEPAGGSGTIAQFGDKPMFDDQATTSITLDTQQYNSFFLYPAGDITVGFATFDDGDNTSASAMFGTTYSFVLVSSGNNSITFDANETIYGDHSVQLGSDSSGTNISATLLKMYYDGFSWIVVDKVTVTDYNP
jgi:hypothetical protein